LLAPFGYGPDDAARAAACLEELKERRERHAAAVATLEQTRRDRIRAEEELDALAGQRAALLDGIGAEDEHALRSLAGQRQARLDAENALELARRELARADAALLEAAGRTGERVGEEGAEAIVAELQGATLAEIDARLSAAEAGALEERAVADEIAGIRRSLEDARSRHDVEDALAAVDAAKADLADRRDRDVDDAIGQALVTWLEGTASDTNRPRVFHRARELLSVITRGQFRLEMSRDGDVFRAYDTVAERGRALDELSSGTRIQLLTAVRVAFVETQEHGAAPPLLLDEVLANADDTRARAIIETALGLARAGRQVFYFTAQVDELEKWRELLTQAGDIEWGEYGLGDPSDGPAFDWSDRRWADRVPAPGDLSHGAYGALLDVPRFDPWMEGVGGLHLWYLVEDVDALHELLDLGIDRYGKLQGFARHGGGLEAIRGVLDDARSHAELCRRFGEYWRRGRGRPVDRAALEESGAVTATFMDRVAALCQRVEGSAQALLAALDEGGVPRFRTASIEDLRDFFLRAGHLDEAEPLDDDAIRVRLVGLATSHFGPDAANDVVCRLIERLRHGPARVREGAR
ncbi:MAG: ATP-binding protein, partial [Gemmatimonadota bacterium]